MLPVEEITRNFCSFCDFERPNQQRQACRSGSSKDKLGHPNQQRQAWRPVHYDGELEPEEPETLAHSRITIGCHNTGSGKTLVMISAILVRIFILLILLDAISGTLNAAHCGYIHTYVSLALSSLLYTLSTLRHFAAQSACQETAASSVRATMIISRR